MVTVRLPDPNGAIACDLYIIYLGGCVHLSAHVFIHVSIYLCIAFPLSCSTAAKALTPDTFSTSAKASRNARVLSILCQIFFFVLFLSIKFSLSISKPRSQKDLHLFTYQGTFGLFPLYHIY